jgi:hypothetical protein
MFKTIINKFERYVIEYIIKHKKPDRIEKYDDKGHIYRYIDNIFHSQSRYTHDELGNQLCWIYARNGKVYEYNTSEYDGDRCTKTHIVRFEDVGNTRVKVEDCHVTYKPDDSGCTIIENGVEREEPGPNDGVKTETKKDDHGNILETIETNDTTQTIYRTVSTYDEHDNELTNKATRTVGGKTKDIYSTEYEYDVNGNEILYKFYWKTDYGTNEHITVTTKEYDEKNRIIHAHEASRDYKRFYSSDDDVYYRYDDEHNAVIKFNDLDTWSYKKYEQTDILPNGYKIVRSWSIPIWTEKVRKFFNVD